MLEHSAPRSLARFHGSIILCWTALLAPGCADPPPPRQPNDHALPAVEASAERSDTGPVLERSIAVLEPERREAPVQALAVQRADGHTYVAVPNALVSGDLVFLDVDAGVRHGFAAPGILDAQPVVLVRLVTEAEPADFSVTATAAPLYDEPGQITTMHVAVPPGTPQREDLRTGFYQGAGEWFGQRGWQTGQASPFYVFASHRMLSLAPNEVGRPMPQPRSDLGELMDLYTGMTSVQEALQHDRGLWLRGEGSDLRTVPIAELEGVPLPSHPWDEMIAARGGQPVIEPLAGAIPADALYLHFHDLRTFVRTSRAVDEWLTPVSQALEQRPGNVYMSERYERQLAIHRSELSEKLGHLAAKGVAIVLSDPFLREGTDVSLVFLVENRALLETTLDGYAAEARKRRPDAATTTYQSGPYTVTELATTDREISQHRVAIGDLLIVSNSRGAIDRFVAVAEGKAPPLSASGDFRTMRTIYPFDPDTEDGFLFLGDAFVRHVTSPRVKILQARRMQAQADLAAVGHAALLFGWLEGRAPATTRELIEAGLLRDSELSHADGAPITFDPVLGARSVRWGARSALTPLVDVAADRATAEEAAAYGRFRDGYQSYWRGYIDPIAVRISETDDGRGLSLDGRMLPLIENTDYDEILEQVGGRHVQVPSTDRGIAWVLALGPEAELRRDLSRLTTGVLPTANLDWLGDWVVVGAADRSGLWDAALAAEAIPEGRRQHDETRAMVGLGRAPIYLAVHVRNTLGLAAILSGLKLLVESSAPGAVQWGGDGAYRDTEIVAIREQQPLVGSGQRERIALYYAIAQDVLLVSFDRTTIELQIDAVLDERMPRPVSAEDSAEARDAAVQTALRVTPGPGGWLARTVLGLLEAELIRTQQSAAASFEVLARGHVASPDDDAAWRIAALGYLGYVPETTAGGRFRINEDGVAEHSLYGSVARPVLPPLPIADASLTQAVMALERLDLGLAFEHAPGMSGLHVRIDWVRR